MSSNMFRGVFSGISCKDKHAHISQRDREEPVRHSTIGIPPFT